MHSAAAVRKSALQSGRFQASTELSEKWKRGSRVYHDDWGYGQIVSSDTSDDGEFVIAVQFESGAKKRFMPEYQSHSLMLVRD